jgi:DNA mismatch repair protein MutL
VIDEFHRVALAHPNIAFVLYNNGSEIFNLPITNHRQRIVNIFGTKTNEKLVPVSEDTEILAISGFVGKPEFAKKTRGEQYFFVNNRFIKSPYLNHAVASAFEGLLKNGMHPSYFLYLRVNPQSIDINIHPTKTEIKFDDEHTLYALLRSAVKHSLGQFNIAPVLDFERDPNLDTLYNQHTIFPSVEVDKDFNPFKETYVSGRQLTAFKKQTLTNWESLYVGLESKGTKTQQDFSEVHFESQPSTETLFEEDKTVDNTQTTYQIHNKYIVSAIKSGMLIMDQHRAHQRILYEDFLKNLTVKGAFSQQLLFPLQLHFSKQDIEIIKQLKEDLEHTGFMFSSVSKETVEITGLPIGVPESEVSMILEQLISDVEHEVPNNNFSITDLLAKSLAKSLAIKNGQQLKKSEQEHLVNSLFACKEPNVSPTNRTTFITMSVDELDKKFI